MIVGVIGAGRIGKVHATILSALEISRLLIADTDRDRAVELSKAIPGAAAADIARLFEVSDAVVIASSTDSHASLLHLAAQAGVTAFCQKPIALDLESTRAAIEAVEQAGITVQMGFQRRYDPAMRRLQDRVQDGGIGRVYLVRSQTHDPEPPPLDYIPVSGGIFKDCLIHDIDAVRYVTGQEVVSVMATGAVLGFPEIGELGDVDSAVVNAELSEGTLAQLSCLRHDPIGYDVRLEVFGSADSIAAGFGPTTPINSAEADRFESHRPTRTWYERFEEAYRIEMEAFVRVANGIEAPASTPRDAEAALRIATACDISMAERRLVSVEEIE